MTVDKNVKLLARSFFALSQIDPGFRTANVRTFQLAIPRSKYPNDAGVAALCTRLVERVANVSGVSLFAMVNRVPLAGVGQVNLLEFETRDGVASRVSSDTRTVTPGYFRTMGIPLKEGRDFTIHDAGTIQTPRFGPMPPSGIVDERLAGSVWPGQSAIGKRFRFAVDGAPWMDVIGVVGHIRHDSLDVDPRPQVYFNYLQCVQDRIALVVRGTPDVRDILRAIREVDPEQPVYDVRMLDEVLDQSLAQRWLNTVLVMVFAVIALTLASIGVYGVVAYGVTQQIREFGIRLALGARRADITRLVLRRGVMLALSGVGIGLTAAVALARTLQSLLYGVQPTDVTSFAAATMLLLAVALLASYVPARRATSIDPALTLRGD